MKKLIIYISLIIISFQCVNKNQINKTHHNEVFIWGDSTTSVIYDSSTSFTIDSSYIVTLNGYTHITFSDDEAEYSIPVDSICNMSRDELINLSVLYMLYEIKCDYGDNNCKILGRFISERFKVNKKQ